MYRPPTPRRVCAALAAAALCAALPAAAGERLAEGERLPTGQSITPTAALGAVFQPLNPGLSELPDHVADHAMTVARSPDGRTLLVLTSGYNRMNGPTGSRVAAASNEYVFVYDATRSPPEKKQVIQIPNSFGGVAWNSSGREFYVTGGVDDVVRVYAESAGAFSEVAPPIALGHATVGLGLQIRPMAAGIAVNASGNLAVIANFENDSASLVDLAARAEVAELDLRPGKIDPAQAGVPGGEFPFWVAIRGDAAAYVSSQRDDEVVVIDLLASPPRVAGRIPVGPQPGKMILDRAQRRLFVANGSGDTVSVIDTAAGKVVATIPVAAPEGLLSNRKALKGANPNALALSPDERTLYVSLGGLNAVSMVALHGERDDHRGHDGCACHAKGGRAVALIPTGWYPSDLALDASGEGLVVVNGKSNAGPNPKACRSTLSIAPGSGAACSAANQYVWQLEKAGLLSFPIPRVQELPRLSLQVAKNNRFPGARWQRGAGLMAFVRSRVKHVIYIIKENRTYDQVLGDLDRGNGDPSLAIFGARPSPNHQALARGFVTLDSFLASGETSGVGWNWTTAARTTDFTEKTQPVNYAGRGLSYDWEGTNRNINVGLATVAERQAALPGYQPADPDLLPGAKDVAAPRYGDGTDAYLWTAALRAGLTVRNYGCFGDGARYSLPVTDPAYIPLERNPHAAGVVQFIPAKQELLDVSDPYFRGYDMDYPDYWRFKEWEREFDGYAERGDLPALSLVRLPHDHFGDFATAIDGINTPEIQMADNDYAVGLLVEKVSKSRYKDDTLVFVVEDDAQNGGDHVDAHRSIAYVVGPYVKQGAVVSAPYDTVSMVRTIEDVLGLEAMGLTDGLAEPMWEVFEKKLRPWTYRAIVPEPLRQSSLPLPLTAAPSKAKAKAKGAVAAAPARDAAWWEAKMAGLDFTREDNLDSDRFNRVLWAGMKGEDVPYPEVRHGRDLSRRFGRTPGRVAAAR
jgi:YVTN family beta-propeller protein